MCQVSACSGAVLVQGHGGHLQNCLPRDSRDNNTESKVGSVQMLAREKLQRRLSVGRQQEESVPGKGRWDGSVGKAEYCTSQVAFKHT